MNSIERAKRIIELSEKVKKAFHCEDEDLSIKEWIECDNSFQKHAPEIAKLFLEAVEILESISMDFYNHNGRTIKDFPRESLEEVIINDTNMAKSFVELVKGKK